jgi:hypothetical protein
MQYDVFLSYSRRNVETMQKVCDILRDCGLTVWTDEGIAVGTSSWKSAIETAILQSKYLVCILSPSANQSQWVRAELDFAELQGKRIFLILAEGDERTAIPFGFATNQWADIRNADENEIINQVRNLAAGLQGDTATEITDTLRVDDVKHSAEIALSADAIAYRIPSLVHGITVDQKKHNALAIINNAESPPLERAQAGDDLNPSDPRRGVGIRMDGIPDIDWMRIPEGQFAYQNKQHSLPTFYISRYLVTAKQYQAFITAPDGYSNDKWWDGLAVRQKSPGKQTFAFSNHPRETISWYDAVAYCRWLSKLLQYEVRLPTDAEWEKAARGTDERVYPWGNDLIGGYANIMDTSTGMIMQTTAVGIFTQAASPYGILDMAGNVWEWCSSLFDYPDENALDDVGQRILRGGSWYNSATAAQTTYRNAGDADGRSPLVGFRVARSAPSH